MGGEPLCSVNLDVVISVIKNVNDNIDVDKIYLWTGYLYEDLIERIKNDSKLKYILSHIDVLIDGPYIEEERDITLPMRGSRNQRIWDLKTGEDITDEYC